MNVFAKMVDWFRQQYVFSYHFAQPEALLVGWCLLPQEGLVRRTAAEPATAGDNQWFPAVFDPSYIWTETVRTVQIGVVVVAGGGRP